MKFDETMEKIELSDDLLYVILNQHEEFNSRQKFQSNFYYNNNFTHAFNWYTPKYTFSVLVKSPRILIEAVDQEIKLTKFIEKQAILHLLEKNFMDWDFVTIIYLNRSRYFRKSLNKCFSKYKVFGMNDMNRFYEVSLNKIETENLVAKNKYTNVLNQLENPEENIPPKDEKYQLTKISFFYTDEKLKNYYFTLK